MESCHYKINYEKIMKGCIGQICEILYTDDGIF